MKSKAATNRIPSIANNQPDDSFTLGEEDVRTMVRLLGDIAGLDGDQAFKRRELMRGLRTLIDADVWVWNVAQISSTDGRPASISLMQEGFSDSDLARVVEAETDPKLPTPDGTLWTPFYQSQHPVTRQRQQLIDDATWYGHPHTMKYRQGFVDDFVYSMMPMNDIGVPIASFIAFHRRWGRPSFSARDARIVHIMSSEVRWLHEAAVPGNRGERADVLSPRLRGILALVLQGYSRKQMAHHLKLSIHTINDYVKVLYRNFNVSSSSELMRRFMAGDGGDIATSNRA